MGSDLKSIPRFPLIFLKSKTVHQMADGFPFVKTKVSFELVKCVSVVSRYFVRNLRTERNNVRIVCILGKSL